MDDRRWRAGTLVVMKPTPIERIKQWFASREEEPRLCGYGRETGVVSREQSP